MNSINNNLPCVKLATIPVEDRRDYKENISITSKALMTDDSLQRMCFPSLFSSMINWSNIHKMIRDGELFLDIVYEYNLYSEKELFAKIPGPHGVTIEKIITKFKTFEEAYPEKHAESVKNDLISYVVEKFKEIQPEKMNRAPIFKSVI